MVLRACHPSCALRRPGAFSGQGCDWSRFAKPTSKNPQPEAPCMRVESRPKRMESALGFKGGGFIVFRSDSVSRTEWKFFLRGTAVQDP